MEHTISFNLTPLQVILSLAFQIWIIVFPIILLRKINYLTALLHEHLSSDEDISH